MFRGFAAVPVFLVLVHALINPCSIFEKMTSFTPIFNQEGTRKLNDGRRFKEIRVQKNVRSILRNRLKFGKISREDLLCTKIWPKEHVKNDDRNNSFQQCPINKIMYSQGKLFCCVSILFTFLQPQSVIAKKWLVLNNTNPPQKGHAQLSNTILPQRRVYWVETNTEGYTETHFSDV